MGLFKFKRKKYYQAEVYIQAINGPAIFETKVYVSDPTPDALAAKCEMDNKCNELRTCAFNSDFVHINKQDHDWNINGYVFEVSKSQMKEYRKMKRKGENYE